MARALANLSSLACIRLIDFKGFIQLEKWHGICNSNHKDKGIIHNKVVELMLYN